MDKVNVYDFIAYLVPGGTFLFVLLAIVRHYFPGCEAWLATNAGYILLPTIIFAYLFGHVFNSMGKRFEDTFHKQMPIAAFFKRNPRAAKDLAVLAEPLLGFPLEQREKEYSPKVLKLYYSRVSDYLEMNDKTARIETLSSQRLFFRNSAMMFLTVAIGSVIMLALNVLGIAVANNTPMLYGLMLMVSLVSFYPCYYYSRQKLNLIISYTFRGFIALRKAAE